jgi:hypothetical protein
LISERARERAGLRLAQQFPCADALKPKIKLRINVIGLVGEKPDLFHEGKSELHRLSPVPRCRAKDV